MLHKEILKYSKLMKRLRMIFFLWLSNLYVFYLCSTNAANVTLLFLCLAGSENKRIVIDMIAIIIYRDWVGHTR